MLENQSNRKATITVAEDDEPGKARFDKMKTLRPAFEKEGTITAANASKLNDGAAALIVASEDAVKTKNLKPLAKIITHATFAHDPKWFTTAPVGAMKKALSQAGLSASDIDLWEINEAFASVGGNADAACELLMSGDREPRRELAGVTAAAE